MHAQLSFARSHGAAAGGQQSDMSWEADISWEAGIAMETGVSIVGPRSAAALATGSSATDAATTKAIRVRARFMG